MLLVSLLATPIARASGLFAEATASRDFLGVLDEDADQKAEKAQKALEKAMRDAEQGRYQDAHRRYQRLARDFAETEAGQIAARRAQPSAFICATDVVRNGPSENRVDVVFMGEGYTVKHQKAWDKFAQDIPPYFERQKTLGEYYRYFNFIRANLISAEEGVDGYGRTYDTALNGAMRDTYAGHVGVDRKRVFEMLDELPSHDGQAIVFVKRGKLGTGGGGVATIGGQNTKIAIHEFGHSFGRLGDEYAQETHKRDGVGTAPNVSATEDPEEVPWKHWLNLRGANVDIYEGAGGQERGAFKPTATGCVMSSSEFFCRVCREHLVLRIYSHVDPIDSCSPADMPYEMREFLVMRESSMKIELTVLEPMDHKLEVQWWIVPEDKAPQPARPMSAAERARYGNRGSNIGPRSARGRLNNIPAEPHAKTFPGRGGLHVLNLRKSQLEPGRYRVIARAHDTTQMRGERFPWVLQDVDELLWSERAWWVEVP